MFTLTPLSQRERGENHGLRRSPLSLWERGRG